MAEPTPRVLGDSVAQSASLESVGNAVNYHAWLTDLARPYLGEHPVELGSGLGDYADTWVDHESVKAFTACELDPSRNAHLNQRFAADDRVTVTDFDVLDAPEGDHSSFVAFNVLEHIPDHVGALKAAHKLVRPGGYVVMFVPAFEFAMSDFDRQVGHVRRYTKKSLGNAYREAGLEIVDLHYVNAAGLPAWFVMMRLLKGTPGDGPLLQIWDRVVIRLARVVERFVHPPFGQSVLAVGRVPQI